ncbi:DUF4136 domain-containing protein [Jeongeupia naejangsanensis]|uniref:DUF4136 domain-containing protein n=1 Tax=Jeongeupia naejangsanensis TaxID=613195 RepID=A0ABS2BL43_9NEIS|nr:DUF4136 domain-containing protein [Jeongeupia naejangsanensis]MBM3116332.1 DUF4136 domain-containing protein [Jeongeupia naejangsanensis]
MRALVLMALLALLAGCATSPPTFNAEVSVRHQIASDVAGKRFAFKRDASQAQSLLQRQVEHDVAVALEGYGLTLDSNASRADWLVELAYGIDDGKTVTYNQPVWGTTYYTYYRRVYSGNNYVIVPYYYPSTEVVGSQSVSEVVYTRYLAVDVFDRKALAGNEFAKLYEGEAKNRSASQQFDNALPYLTRALFQTFPGTAGTRTVRLPLPPVQP